MSEHRNELAPVPAKQRSPTRRRPDDDWSTDRARQDGRWVPGPRFDVRQVFHRVANDARDPARMRDPDSSLVVLVQSICRVTVAHLRELEGSTLAGRGTTYHPLLGREPGIPAPIESDLVDRTLSRECGLTGKRRRAQFPSVTNTHPGALCPDPDCAVRSLGNAEDAWGPELTRRAVGHHGHALSIVATQSTERRQPEGAVGAEHHLIDGVLREPIGRGDAARRERDFRIDRWGLSPNW